MHSLYANTESCTLAQDVNPYLANTTYKASIAQPGDPALGLMMLLSTLQYQAPYVSPSLSNAATQTGKAAYIQSGGQDLQDKALKKAMENGKGVAYDLGLTDVEMGAFLGVAKTVRDKQIKFNGPKIGEIKTSLTGTERNALLGFKYEW